MSCNCPTCIYPNISACSGTGMCSCTGTCSSTSTKSYNEFITQRRLWNQVRVPSSLFAMNVSSLTIGSSRMKTINGQTNNQSSDQGVPAIQNNPLPSHGNSRKTTLTSLKPGACMPGGKGVDIKHNSYARYLGRKKSANLKTQPAIQAATIPLYGNKKRMIGLVSGTQNCCL